MKPLEKALRGQLERTVREARDVAEAAAVAALKQLGVNEKNPFLHLTESERELRRRLRDHGRQLGDKLNGGAEQTMDRLVEEVAYENWHRMLFARFLAENNLLMYPDSTGPVPVTLEECEDLASKEGGKNGWELAARFAALMLPQIFRQDSPVFQITLPPEHQQKLEQLLDELSHDVFIASDSIGWVYQFWQSKKKDEINASEVKIGARELAAVTQLFTEPYMVSFLLDNSLGAWWAAHRLLREDFVQAKSEEELRQKSSLPGVSLEYLRFVKGEDDVWIPAAGTFDGWPNNLREFKVIDPCCGSGHFLVAALLMLIPMRIAMENLSPKDAVDAVMRDNLHGLEIDRRCVELAAFSLALAAWRYPDAGGYRPLPEFNVACSGISLITKKEDWLTLAGNDVKLRYTLGMLHDQFKDAPVLGSLINPEIGLNKGTLVEMAWTDVEPLLNKAFSGECDDEKVEMGVVAQGIAKAANLLAAKYNLVVTNVPYLARGNQSDELKDHCTRVYPRAQQDLANVFIERCLELSSSYGVVAAVTPQNWLFRFRYKNHREYLLRSTSWKMLTRLGPGAFDTISGQVVQAVLVIFQLKRPIIMEQLVGIDASQKSTTREKATHLQKELLYFVSQAAQLRSPDYRITLFPEEGVLLEQVSRGVTGLITKDAVRFYKYFWEITLSKDWCYSQTSVSVNKVWDGLSKVVYWQQDRGVLREQYKQGISILAGGLAWGKLGVCVSQTGVLPASLYSGKFFDDTVAVIVPEKSELVPAIWAFCESGEFGRAVRKINQALKVTPSTLVKVAFDPAEWEEVAQRNYPKGLPNPYSDDPTQWIFHSHPSQSDEPLQVAVARLLGYRWPAEFDKSLELSEEAYELVKKTESFLSYADEDGIVCIPSVRGEMKAEDQLESLLASVYGSDWSSNKKSELLAQVGYADKSLESWLRESFFTQHSKLFHDRPFIWQVWDGLSDGFSALVNYHKLDAKKLEMLIYTYLGDWISRQKQDLANGVDGAGEKLAAAEALKKRLELILEGESPYDIFVRWKSLEEQPVGWNPDLNDGVRLNIRPFLSVPDVGKKGAGVLRDRPNIKWGKDRGRDVESAPWYKLFKGERINDHHLSLAEKRTTKTT